MTSNSQIKNTIKWRMVNHFMKLNSIFLNIIRVKTNLNRIQISNCIFYVNSSFKNWYILATP
jgi:hypothetical protein